MTIHTGHPFEPSEGRDPVRRLRGRMAAPVTVWASGTGAGREGLTVSSVLVADGEPPHLVALVDEDSDLWTSAPETFAVSLLGEEHRFLADAFAGAAPAPGGPFTLARWTDSAWGPVLTGASGWLGVRLVDPEPRHVGWALLVDVVIEHAEVGDVDPLIHLRGRYRS